MGEARRRGSYDDRRREPKGDAWRAVRRGTMTGAIYGRPGVDGKGWFPPCYRPGERIEYSDRTMRADVTGSLRRVPR